MRFWSLVFAVGWISLIPLRAPAQQTAVTEQMQINGTSASTWDDEHTNIVQINGAVKIQLDRTTLTADDAVVWIQPAKNALLNEQKVDIALLGHARLEQPEVSRSGDRLIVSATVRGEIRITADARVARNLADTPVYQAALTLRPVDVSEASGRMKSGGSYLSRRWQPPGNTAPQIAAPAAQPVRPKFWLELQYGNYQPRQTSDGKFAGVLSGGILILYRDEKDDQIEFTAQQAVVFTSVAEEKNLAGGENRPTLGKIRDKIVAVYLEGDVRVNHTSSAANRGDQRLTANRVYYEFGTDRAILTDAVLHTVDLKNQIPVFVRAQTLRQISRDEFRAGNGQLSTSGMINPSYSLNAEKMYVHNSDTGDPRLGRRTEYSGSNVTMQAWGVPFFYTPGISGEMTQRGDALRDISIGQSNKFGFGTQATVGIFEAAGQPRPQDLDAVLSLGYFDRRGPAVGIDGKYDGGFVSETTRQPWNFQGSFQSYMVDDRATDRLGAARAEVEPPRDIRGTFLWQHQHFFPDDWQAQVRIGYVSDATFLEQWFPKYYDDGLPRDMSIYLKRQRNTEAFTLFINTQPSNAVTSAEFVQEQFEIEHLPEIGYHRIGDSTAGDTLTFFSDNSAGGYRFAQGGASLLQQGFYFGVEPGLPSLGKSGVTDDTVYRGDFRQELDMPFSTAHLRWVPYVFGRYTTYSDSPGGRTKNRIYAGTGTRITTQFWGVDDAVESDWLDIHRLRHVIEPEINLYTSAQSVDQNEVFNFDEQADPINDVSAVQLALHQRWQTKRGGPGRWRSVDFFTLNVAGNFFSNQPDDPALNPANFRGLFFPTLPEASVPKNSINADAIWRLTDSTAILSDMQMNLDREQLATASIGLAARRDEHTTFFVGTRYIEELQTNITTLSIDYQLNEKYQLAATQSFDFGQSENVSYNFTVTRKFDRFFFQFRLVYDQTTNETGFSFNFMPYGLGQGLGVTSDQLNR